MVQADGTLRLELIFLYSASGGGCNGQRMMSDAIRWYDQNISEVSRRYESVAANTVYGGWSTYFQTHQRWCWTSAPGLVATRLGSPRAGWKSPLSSPP